MDTEELFALVRDLQIEPFYAGAHSYDVVGRKTFTKRPQFAIINTQKSGSQGEHWFLLFRPEKTAHFDFLIFDSLGTSKAAIYSRLPFLRKKKISFNKSAFQPRSSLMCGRYAAVIAAELLMNGDLDLRELLEEVFDGSRTKFQNDRTIDGLVFEFTGRKPKPLKR